MAGTATRSSAVRGNDITGRTAEQHVEASEAGGLHEVN
jgi:hypothetical protein